MYKLPVANVVIDSVLTVTNERSFLAKVLEACILRNELVL
jgi:hypothetical protein